MLILLLGDCHGRFDLVHQACREAHALWGVEAAIQVGDFGFHPRLIQSLLDQSGLVIPLHVIDGNHEDHRWLHGALASGEAATWFARGNLQYHPRGSVTSIGGTRIGLLGGALHADRRQEWADQWKVSADARRPTTRTPPRDPAWANWIRDEDIERAAIAFNEAPLDLIVTHSCPADIGIGMRGSEALVESVDRWIRRAGFGSSAFNDCGEIALTRLWKQLTNRPPNWVFGHFHCLHERTIDTTRFVCVGSTDDTDGFPGIRPVIFDTDRKRLIVHANTQIGGPDH